MPALETRGLTKRYGDTIALDGLSITVPEGSVYGFLGPNGAGKTTTIKLTLGLLEPTAGTVTVLGEEVTRGQLAARTKSRLTYLPQDPVFPAALNGREVLEFVAGVYGVPQGERASRVSELLHSFDLETAARRKVGTYSRGMKQRLGLAAVLLPKPELLVLDEPVSALDPEGRHVVLGLVSELRGSATVFFSSHVLNDVQRVCDRVAIIRNGRLIVDSPLVELLARYSPSGYELMVAPGDADRCEDILRQESLGLDHVEVRGNGSFAVQSLAWDDRELASRVLPVLIQEGIVVTEFAPVRTELEEIFVQIVRASRAGGEGQ